MAPTTPDSSAALLVSADLFFASKVTGTARELGLRVDVEGDAARAAGRAADYRCLIVDLGTPRLQIGDLVAALPVQGRPRVIAFGAHVHTAQLDAARSAGCDEVLPRSRFSATLPELLRRELGANDIGQEPAKGQTQ